MKQDGSSAGANRQSGLENQESGNLRDLSFMGEGRHGPGRDTETRQSSGDTSFMLTQSRVILEERISVEKLLPPD